MNGFKKFNGMNGYKIRSQSNILKNKNTHIENKENIKYFKKDYLLTWYVVEETDKIKTNQLYETTIWEKQYVYWKDKKGVYYAMDNHCSHRGAALSRGFLNKTNNCVVCPYHGYEFEGNGTLSKVPGLSFTPSPCKNQATYPMVERNGWLYMNTISRNIYKEKDPDFFQEEESKDPTFTSIQFQKDFHAYSRIVSENSLDVMHIGFVHTFGNRERPSPTAESPPFCVGDHPFHYKTSYKYIAGKDSVAKKIYKKNDLIIENEFSLPHTTIARVRFGEFVSTVVTFATPRNQSHTTLFVKTYRNFLYQKPKGMDSCLINAFGDSITKYLMEQTVMQDKEVIEHIPMDKMDGTFNMKYDKLQNVYRQLYKQWVHNPKNG
jgi:phenylpropionate dioxygenase-like ring-hydroxylating dioxygenase large terminal subunit